MTDVKGVNNIINNAPAVASSNGLSTRGDDDLIMGPMIDKNIHYPLQRAPYMSPMPMLSFESKRIMRQAQEPQTSVRVAHYLYEVTLDRFAHSTRSS